MIIKVICDFFKDAFKSIKRNNSLNITVVSTIIITFLLLGVFIITALNLRININKMTDNVEIRVNLKDEISKVEKNKIELNLKENDNVRSVKYESKTKAFKDLEKSLEGNEDLLEGYTLENNPLLDSFIIKFNDVQSINNVLKEVGELNGVDSITNQNELINTINKFLNFVKVIAIVLIILFVGITIFLISNTIRISIYNRKKELAIMKVLGATELFIKCPFVIEGILITLIGTTISIGILMISYLKIYSLLIDNNIMANPLSPINLLQVLSVTFMILSIIIGTLSSNSALKKFLAD